MAQSRTFRTVLFGGYKREEVDEYIKTLEHEIESIKELHQKEKLELMRKAEDSEAELALVKADLESARGQIKKEELEKNSGRWIRKVRTIPARKKKNRKNRLKFCMR